jgi:hypothetical protein
MGMATHDLHVRIDEETYSALAAYAKENRRSVASAVDYLILRGLEAQEPLFKMHYSYKSGVDSEPWTCQGCGGQFIGRRPEGDRCKECRAVQEAQR